MPNLVYKFSAGLDNLAYILRDKTVRFTPPIELNDPFEFAFDLCGTIESWSQEGVDTYSTTGITAEISGEIVAHHTRDFFLRQYSNVFGVLSLSKTRDDILLWAHYGRSHTGFAVGFDRSHSFFQQVQNRGWTGLQDVVYSEQRPRLRGVGVPNQISSQQELAEAAIGAALTKSPHWSYEQEVRAIAILDFPNICKPGPLKGIVEYPTEAVKEIIIGARADDETIETIFALHESKYRDSQLLVSWLDPHLYRVNILPARSKKSLLDIRNTWRDSF